MSNAQVLPDLEIGVETPRPLKREGKQVYAKLIDFGGFPAPYGLKAKTHDVPDIEWSQISWDYSYVSSSTDGRKRSLALVSTPAASGGSMPWRFLVDSTSVQVNMLTGTDYREWDTIVLCLLYTKESQGAQGGSLIVPGEDGMVLTSRDNRLVWEEPSGACFPPAGLPKSHKRLTLTESGTWTAPETAWYAITLVGGGGAGGGSRKMGGRQGGATSFIAETAEGGSGGGGGGYYGGVAGSGGGGGGAGKVRTVHLLLSKDQECPFIIGAGGRHTTTDSEPEGPERGRNGGHSYRAGQGASGAGNGGSGQHNMVIPGPGGHGAPTGLGYGGGGGGASGNATNYGAHGGKGADGGENGADQSTKADNRNYGGDGGPGVIFIEYYSHED